MSKEVCGPGARYTLFSDALACMAALCESGEDVDIRYDNKPDSDHYVPPYEVVVRESKATMGCSVAVGSKPEPTWLEKFLKAIGFI